MNEWIFEHLLMLGSAVKAGLCRWTHNLVRDNQIDMYVPYNPLGWQLGLQFWSGPKVVQRRQFITWTETEENKEGRFLIAGQILLNKHRAWDSCYISYLKIVIWFSYGKLCTAPRATVCLVVYGRQHDTWVFWGNSGEGGRFTFWYQQ